MTNIEEDSNLVQHAIRELDLLGEDEPIKSGLINLVRVFAEQGHSGSSAEYTLERLNQLLNFENIMPLTHDLDEWIDRTEISGYPFWQNKRNPKVFSEDGGRTISMVLEGKSVDISDADGNVTTYAPTHANK